MMRCLTCHKLSIQTFCRECQERILKPSISQRNLGSFTVYSFFKYHNIKYLLLKKHTPEGYIIYKALAKIIFKPFMEMFITEDTNPIYIIGVDESVESGYSHVALLTHSMRLKGVKVLHNKLIAKSRIKYSGKSLQFRLENPRGFIYNGLSNIDAILVDDIITTGTTLKEAKEVLEKGGVNLLFALTLADV